MFVSVDFNANTIIVTDIGRGCWSVLFYSYQIDAVIQLISLNIFKIWLAVLCTQTQSSQASMQTNRFLKRCVTTRNQIGRVHVLVVGIANVEWLLEFLNEIENEHNNAQNMEYTLWQIIYKDIDTESVTSCIHLIQCRKQTFTFMGSK